MVNEVLLEKLREIVGGQAVRRDVPMSGLTTFQIGGPAAVVVEPASVQEAADALAACHGAGQPVRLLGLAATCLWPMRVCPRLSFDLPSAFRT